MKNSIQEINRLNDFAWGQRYSHSLKALQIAKKTLKLSSKMSFLPGESYSKLIISAANFILSKPGNWLGNLNEALQFFESTGDKTGQAKTMNLIGNIYDSYGDYGKGLEYCRKGFKIAQETGYAEGEGDISATLGHLYTHLSDYDDALQHYQNSFKIREQLNDTMAMASSLNLIARTYGLLGDFKTAIRYYYRCLRLREKIKDKEGVPWTLLGLSSLYEKSKKYDKALKSYLYAIELNKKSGEKRLELHCMLGICRIFNETNRADESIKNLLKAKAIARSLGAKPLLYETYGALAVAYEKKGDIKKSLENFKLFHSLKEEVLSAETSNRLRQQQVSFAVERSEKEKEIFRLKNVELKNAYSIIEEKNKDITDSIHYASRIQRAILVPEYVIRQSFSDFFIFYRPKDIISGDFYYFGKTNDWIVFAAVDCTGHGVPGALMSMIGNSLLNEIIHSPAVRTLADLFSELDMKLKNALNPSGIKTDVKDGMEIAAMAYDVKSNKLQLGGANRTALAIQNNVCTEVQESPMGIGDYDRGEKNFSFTEFSPEPGTMVYLTSDGYEDQSGGPKGKRFQSARLKELLTSIASKPVDEQKEIIEKTFDDWKGMGEQTDDVTVIGIRL